jgi:peptidoglycan hydrolase-like protein with peptidoglycan-binding domain
VLAAAGVAVVVVVSIVLVVVDPFGAPASAGSALDNGAPTALQTVVRRDLSEQTQVSATLGYADPSTMSVPGGTAPASVQQAQEAVASAQSTLAADQRTLTQAQATLAADTRKVSVDCRGGNAAASESPCATGAQSLTTDRQSVTAAQDKVDADDRALASAQASLAQSQDTAATYGQNAVYTTLPKAGAVVRRNESLYAIGGQPAVLLYGNTPASRAFMPGMTPGRDVNELNWNLHTLGYGTPSGDAYTSETASAVERFQRAHGMAATGELLLGSVVFAPGAVRVTTVTPTLGAAVQPGPVLGVTSTRRVVTIALDAAAQSSVKVGDPVLITLPDNSTTTGRVSFVGTVATTPSSDNGNGSSSPTIEVDVAPDHPAATGRLDQASVDVSITSSTVRNVLAVPVNALVALAGGGYAVEVAGAAGARRLVAVSLGLVDDADGYVQVSGSGLSAGQRVVVPAA